MSATDTVTATATPPAVTTLTKQVSSSVTSPGTTLLYTLVLNVGGNSPLNMVVTDQLPANLTFVSFGTVPAGTNASYNQATSIMSWQMPSPLALGVYQMTYQATVNNLIAGGITIQNCAVANYTGAAAPITACANTLTTGQYTVKVGLYNSAGELVVSLPVSQYSQAINSFTLSSGAITAVSGPGSSTTIKYLGIPIDTWNGLDASGNPVLNGEYYVKIDSVGNMGTDTSVTQPIIVNRSVYKVAVKIYNEAGEVVKNLYVYSSNPGTTNTTQLQLSATSFEPTSGTATGNIPNQLTVTLNNGTTVVWDGTGDNGSVVASGQYYIEVTAQDGQGGETILTAHVMVMSDTANAGMGNITARPNLMNPTTGYSVQFISDSAQSLTLVYRVYDAAGELVKRSATGAAGANQTDWDASGVASGMYFAVVDAYNNQGGIIGHQNLKIVVVR